MLTRPTTVSCPVTEYVRDMQRIPEKTILLWKQIQTQK